MTAIEKLNKKIKRIQRWADRVEHHWTNLFVDVESLYKEALSTLQLEQETASKKIEKKTEVIHAQMNQAGKDYVQKKYQLERASNGAGSDVQNLEEEYKKYLKTTERELTVLSQEKVNAQVAFEKQQNALRDMYQEQRHHLRTMHEKKRKELTTIEEKLKKHKLKSEKELAETSQEKSDALAVIKEQFEAKKSGWAIALETLKKNVVSLNEEKQHFQSKLSTIHEEKEKELLSVRTELAIMREQLEVDKATIIEKADADQRQCEEDVRKLTDKIEASEKEFQGLIIGNDQKKKDAEEGYTKEEAMLKETLTREGEKRDYERALLEQEKISKEKELGRLRDDYEAKKWHWENQIRTLMMQKSVQDSEFDADRLRVDREARTQFRSLEAKRDSLKQRMSEIKFRHDNMDANARKEFDLMEQRWNWRRDRLWGMWQNRLEMIKKERGILSKQMDELVETFQRDQKQIIGKEESENQRTGDLQQFMVHKADLEHGKKKQKEIQLELEKTRIIAQVRECETLVIDWQDRIKLTEAEVSKRSVQYGDQIGFVNQLLTQEAKEAEVYLGNLRRALASLGNSTERVVPKGRAA